jgi:hypothetical protein
MGDSAPLVLGVEGKGALNEKVSDEGALHVNEPAIVVAAIDRRGGLMVVREQGE